MVAGGIPLVRPGDRMTRAALTGLRKRGYAIQRNTSEAGISVYRIPVAEPAPVKRGRQAAAKAA